MEHLFGNFWWIIFPIFGMSMGVLGMIQNDQRTRRTLDLIRSYVEQGKEPPPELLKLAQRSDDGMGSYDGSANSGSRAWTFVVFAALAAGFATGYWFIRGEDFAFPFLIVAVTMGVLALGALGILVAGRK
jgi:uncharacterized membrane protein